jgi:hypothetical protein
MSRLVGRYVVQRLAVRCASVLVLLFCLVATSQTQPIELNVLDFGAVGDGLTDDTVAIHKTFAACAAGASSATVVVFPTAHTFLTGPFNVSCSNVVVQFHGNVQALSKAVSNTTVWPIVPAYPSYGGRDRAHPFIWIVQQSNVTLTGAGTVDGAGATWWALSKSLSYDDTSTSRWARVIIGYFFSVVLVVLAGDVNCPSQCACMRELQHVYDVVLHCVICMHMRSSQVRPAQASRGVFCCPFSHRWHSIYQQSRVDLASDLLLARGHCEYNGRLALGFTKHGACAFLQFACGDEMTNLDK